MPPRVALLRSSCGGDGSLPPNGACFDSGAICFGQNQLLSDEMWTSKCCPLCLPFTRSRSRLPNLMRANRQGMRGRTSCSRPKCLSASAGANRKCFVPSGNNSLASAADTCTPPTHVSSGQVLSYWLDVRICRTFLTTEDTSPCTAVVPVHLSHDLFVVIKILIGHTPPSIGLAAWVRDCRCF